MTGVAAQMCETPDPEFRKKIEEEMPYIKWGARKAILNDLSPAATFIAYNYNTPVDVKEFESEAKRILSEVEAECGWMYETNHTIDGKKQYVQDIGGGMTPVMGRINYTVWSDVFVCPDCTHEIIFWDAAVDKEAGKVRDEFECPFCGARVTKRSLDRAWESVYDDAIEATIKRAKQVPVLINYTVEEGGKKKRYEKMPDEDDLALIKRIEESRIPYWYPIDPMMFKGERWGDTWRAGVHAGITHVHHFYTKRNLWVLASFLVKSTMCKFKFALTRVANQITQMYRFTYQNGVWGAGGGPLSGTLYIPSLVKELGALKPIKQAIKSQKNVHTQYRVDFPHLL